ncbi:translation initiation factor IF-2-like [Phacochoerus africanus]|uniref:translation initiation factor IF-2-like n=1 Tax=Phacochoerus africanus TaxID=41426 RepID=UPI001FD93F1E|nr:translation initiation factor IF-2-like [Phacochoerus africanus]
MPLGSPLPPPLPMPPPPRPSRLSWPRPRCLPRTIMPSTAAGRGHWAAAAGARAARGWPGSQGTQEALRGAGRGCSVRPLRGLAGTMNRRRANSQTALLFAGLPGKSLLLGCRRRRRLPGHGTSDSAAHVGFRRPNPARRHFPATVAGADASGCKTAPGASPASRSRKAAPAAAAGPRVWPVLARPSQSRAGACTDCAQRPALSRSRPPATPGSAGRRGGPFPPRRFTERGPAPRRHALPDRALRGPPLAVGVSPSRLPRLPLGPAAAELSRDPGPCASDAAARVSLAAQPTQKDPAALRQAARSPAPAIFVNLQLPSEPGETERKGGGRKAEEKTPASSPRAASPRSAAVGTPPPARSPARRSCWRLFLFPSAPRPRARRRRLGRNLPGAYRNLLCGVTAFRLNPASSSRPSSRPLRRSRMLARCAAPPPGSWVAEGGRPRPARTLPAPGWWSRASSVVLGGEAGTADGREARPGPGLGTHPWETRAQPPVGLT